ncbi:MAG: cyanophycin synthetase, partial [Nitrospirota bacterium]|nr:cyanophycin synthetase [Nitrospirota bacterium]
HRRFLTYGLSEKSDIYASNVKQGFMSTTFDVTVNQADAGTFTIPIPGRHNVLNSLACIGVALELKMHPAAIKEALSSFGGIQRRFEFKGEAQGVKVYDDYGHHPTEVHATLSAAKENMKHLSNAGRLFVVFQPHRYTRTADLMDEFAGSFLGVDALILLDIYPASEKPIPGITSELLAEKMKQKGQKNVTCFRDREEATNHLVVQLKKGDVLLTLGAGDVWKMGESVVERLNAD